MPQWQGERYNPGPSLRFNMAAHLSLRGGKLYTFCGVSGPVNCLFEAGFCFRYIFFDPYHVLNILDMFLRNQEFHFSLKTGKGRAASQCSSFSAMSGIGWNSAASGPLDWDSHCQSHTPLFLLLNLSSLVQAPAWP